MSGERSYLAMRCGTDHGLNRHWSSQRGDSNEWSSFCYASCEYVLFSVRRDTVVIYMSARISRVDPAEVRLGVAKV